MQLQLWPEEEEEEKGGKEREKGASSLRLSTDNVMVVETAYVLVGASCASTLDTGVA